MLMERHARARFIPEQGRRWAFALVTVEAVNLHAFAKVFPFEGLEVFGNVE
jgi:hypothetical protein